MKNTLRNNLKMSHHIQPVTVKPISSFDALYVHLQSVPHVWRDSTHLSLDSVGKIMTAAAPFSFDAPLIKHSVVNGKTCKVLDFT